MKRNWISHDKLVDGITVWDYTFDLKYQQGKKMFVSEALSRLSIEAQNDVLMWYP